MLSVEGVSKAYDTPRGPLPVLEDVSFTLGAGESLCVVGPSGSGKSTLLYIIGTLERPSAGSVRVEGRDVHALGEAELAAFRNREVGFVFQDHFLLPQLSVLENVLAPTRRSAVPASRRCTGACSCRCPRGRPRTATRRRRA